MDFSESDEQRMLRDAVAELARQYGHSYFIKQARSNLRATELWTELGDAGFLGVAIGQEYGGGGMGISEMNIVAEELAASGCPNLLLAVLAVCAPVIEKFGNPEQRQEWLPTLASGKAKMSIGITEPNAGSNSHRISTIARRAGAEYRVNGTKHYISGMDEAEYVLTLVRTPSAEGRTDGDLSLLAIECASSGISLSPIPLDIVSTERQFTVFFEDVEVPVDHLIGVEGSGLRHLFHGLNAERMVSAAVATGIGRYALGKAARYASDRVVWDVPIGSHQGVAHPLAEAYAQVELARLMNQKASWLYDHGHESGEASNIAKHAAASSCLTALERAIQVHGGNGLAAEYGLADLWGIARMYGIAPVSQEMVLNYIARHSLHLPKPY